MMSRPENSDFFGGIKRNSNQELHDSSPERKLQKLNQDDDNQREEYQSGSKGKPKKTEQVSKKSFAKEYMLKHGYKEGSGLGKNQNGIIQPVEASKQKGRRGLGFEAIDLKTVVSEYDPNLEDISFDEEVIWLINEHHDTLNKNCLDSWLKIGPPKKCINSDSCFCDGEIIHEILSTKNVLDLITEKDLEFGRRRSNPFEIIKNAIFLNRAAMKMANMDAILDRMFTEPKNIHGENVIGPNDLLYFADVCAGPGGFSEYVLFRKKWRAKGFGFTLRNQNDFLLDKFCAGPSETFEPHYGAKEDGNIFLPENILSFRDHVLRYTDGKGVHFMMADGGVQIDEKFNDQELICKKLYLCQCLVALFIVRTEGHFIVKLFDLFTEFSVGLIYLMYRSFREILIVKPNTSRPANSERYLVCKWKRDDCRDIAKHLFEINDKVPSFGEKRKEDVLEVVPGDVLKGDAKFFEYITSSNNKIGKRQIINLKKLVTFSEKVELKDERQPELRKKCLRKWDIPDEARAEPKKYDPRTKCVELLGTPSFELFDVKKKVIDSFEYFKQFMFSIHDWYCIVVSGEETNSSTFYLGLGRNNVHKYGAGKWTKWNDGCCAVGFCLPANTLIYGELVREYLGKGKGQRKIFAFHIIDGMFLGGEDIRRFSLKERLDKCGLFAKSLNKETFPVRVKSLHELADIHLLRQNLVLESIKSSSFKSLCVSLEQDAFYKAGGIEFIKSTRGDWHRYFSNTNRAMFFDNRKEKKKMFESEVNSADRVYADFEHCFHTRMIWLWGEDVHENQKDPNKMQWENLVDYLRRK